MGRSASRGAVYLLIMLGQFGCQTANRESPSAKSKTAGAPAGGPVRLVSGLGHVHHVVTTQSAEAQQYFDQGLAYCYAFNHAEAVRSFTRAAGLDPNCAMACWGEALALGPNINMDVDVQAEKAAYAAVQKAVRIARRAHVSEQEIAYITALADPRSDLKKLAVDYKNAMGEVVRQYPDDLDAATLYAESAMDVRPWKLWTKEGQPAEGTEEIVSVLESVLQRDPDHLGANHYYIHAVEASPLPQRALPCARRLPALAPAAGHLVHMPAHVYMRVGDYAAALKANQSALGADEKYISCCKPQPGVYPLMYVSHNRHFLAAAACMTNQSKLALPAADELGAAARSVAKDMPMVEPFAAVPILVRARFAMWEDVINQPAPDAKALPATNAAWHFARGMALAAARQIDAAKAELWSLRSANAALGDRTFGNNSAAAVMKIGEHLLAGRIAGESGDARGAIAEYRQAVAAQDVLDYDEPPSWPWPVRETLGAALLKSGRGAAAESVFRDDLNRNPRNPRSLLGLAKSLEAQNRDEGGNASTAADNALRDADVKVTLADL
jgi:tetratricopeptide (TPR) repeat protein